MENNAAKIVSSAIIGADVETITVNGKRYVIMPPTIKKIAGAAYWLSDIQEAKTLKEMFMSINNVEALAHALSWFINGNDDLSEELVNGTQDEVIKGLELSIGTDCVIHGEFTSDIHGSSRSNTISQFVDYAKGQSPYSHRRSSA